MVKSLASRSRFNNSGGHNTFIMRISLLSFQPPAGVTAQLQIGAVVLGVIPSQVHPIVLLRPHQPGGGVGPGGLCSCRHAGDPDQDHERHDSKNMLFAHPFPLFLPPSRLQPKVAVPLTISCAGVYPRRLSPAQGRRTHRAVSIKSPRGMRGRVNIRGGFTSHKSLFQPLIRGLFTRRTTGFGGSVDTLTGVGGIHFTVSRRSPGCRNDPTQ